MKNIQFTTETEQERVNAIYNADLRIGAFYATTYERDVKVTKEYKGKVKVTKRTSGVYRYGVQYSHTNAFKALEREVQPLPNSQATDNLLQWTIGEDGQPKDYKVRCFTVPNQKSQSVWYLDGKETTKEELQTKGIIPQDKPSTQPLTMFTVFVRNIVAIGAKA